METINTFKHFTIQGATPCHDGTRIRLDTWDIILVANQTHKESTLVHNHRPTSSESFDHRYSIFYNRSNLKKLRRLPVNRDMLKVNILGNDFITKGRGKVFLP